MATEQAGGGAATATAPGADAPQRTSRHSNSYDIFILVLTLFSLAIMVLLLLPLGQATIDALSFFDDVICVIFLFDFAINLLGSHPRREYFVYQRGWLDLLGSIPSLGFFPAAGLLRLARLSRLARITRLLQGSNRRALVQDVVQNRGQYALFITFLAAFLVITTSTLLMVQAETKNPDSNIKTGGDALWWAFVTITTVGYGDRYPVTLVGRAVAIFVMFAGVGIIGSLASILASILVPSPEETAASAAAAAKEAGTTGVGEAGLGRVLDELATIRAELAELRATNPPAGATDGPPAPG
jgi:voltage-gated potassium channel